MSQKQKHAYCSSKKGLEQRFPYTEHTFTVLAENKTEYQRDKAWQQTEKIMN